MLRGHISGSRTENPRFGSRGVLHTVWDDGDLFGLQPVTDRGKHLEKLPPRALRGSAGLEDEPSSSASNWACRRRQNHV